MSNETAKVLEELKAEIENTFGFHEELGEARINLGPCAPFAKSFSEAWNARFEQKTHICFVMDKENNECWHTLVRLPGGKLYDGGVGLHTDANYDSARFEIEEMLVYDEALLEERAYGIDRSYSRYCPDF